jgi:SAM-dependent methyltransferase
MSKLIKPEQEYKDPNEFYTYSEVERYGKNSGMKKTQQMLTKIALDLVHFDKKKKYKVLDIGCGTCFSLDCVLELNQNKDDLIGCDPSKEMYRASRKKGYRIYNMGFEDIKKIKYYYPSNHFDIIISISALNWVCANKKELELKNEIKKIGIELYKLVKDTGKIVLQFYVDSEEIYEMVASSFSRCDFEVEKYIYNEKSAIKRKYFLVLHKK